MATASDRKATLTKATELLGARSTPRGNPRWSYAEVCGRLVEVSGWRASATYTSALSLLLDAQRAGETTVWIGPTSRSFFPPDAQAIGLDLEALAVVRMQHPDDVPVAADLLARSGGFGALVLDLGTTTASMGVLSRLAGLARAHEAAIVLLTEKSPEHPSLGSVVSFRACASFQREREGLFHHELAVSRDRVRSIAWRQVEVRRGPPGLS